jgi:hypothetical protein
MVWAGESTACSRTRCGHPLTCPCRPSTSLQRPCLPTPFWCGGKPRTTTVPPSNSTLPPLSCSIHVQTESMSLSNLWHPRCPLLLRLTTLRTFVCLCSCVLTRVCSTYCARYRLQACRMRGCDDADDSDSEEDIEPRDRITRITNMHRGAILPVSGMSNCVCCKCGHGCSIQHTVALPPPPCLHSPHNAPLSCFLPT